VIDIVLQGPVYPNTFNAARSYSDLPFVDKVIISTWENQPLLNEGKIQTAISEQPHIKNTVTMNCQIISTQTGLERCTSDIVVKARSDQTIERNSMILMNDYFNKGSSRFYVLGINGNYAYHPQDHVFWGFRKDMVTLFDVPMVPDDLCHLDFNNTVRFPMWLGYHYMNRFFDLSHYMKDIKTYFTDNAPLRNEPIEHSRKWIHKFFAPFPRIRLWWEKYKTDYWYDDYSRQGEYYAD